MVCCEERTPHRVGTFSTVDPLRFSGENRSRFWHKKGRPVRSWLVKNRFESFLLCCD